MAPVDKFNRPGDLAGPAYHASVILPDDATDLTFVTRGIYVGATGDLTVDMAGEVGSDITFHAVPAGSLLPLAAKRVRATGTTASSLVAIW